MIKTSLGLVFIIILAFVSFDFVPIKAPASLLERPAYSSETKRIINEWNVKFSPLLNEPLWTKQNIYDAGHFLMIPLHAAFYLNNKKMIDDFSEQFLLFMRFLDGRGVAATGAGTQNNAQYVYLASRFIYLCYESGYEYLIPVGLHDVIRNFVVGYFYARGKWWKDQEKEMDMDERFTFIMGDEVAEYQYYKVIPDLCLFVTAIAADLLAISENKALNHDETLKYIVDRLYELLKHEVVFLGEGDRWLLHPGRWSDHKDYLYAGHSGIHEEMENAPIHDIAEDSSHFHRFPLFIESWKNAFPRDSQEFAFFERLRIGLAEQMIHSVIVPPSEEILFYRLTNYMCGRNGVYRYNYRTMGQQRGYLPYQLSGTFLLGWWSFLQDVRITTIYKEIFNSFPLSTEAVDCYTGPNTTRERHPSFTFPNVLFPKEIAYYISFFSSKMRSK